MIRHRWDVSPSEARQIQTVLGQDVAIRPLDRPITNVAGVDVSTKGRYAVAAAVLLSYPGLELLGSAVVEAEATFPYVPGLLAFREGPAAPAALRRWNRCPTY